MPDKQIIDVNLEGLPRPLAAAVRYLAEQSWQINDNYAIPTSDAAKMLGIPRSTLNLWCRQGKVKAIQSATGRAWRVDVEDCRQYMLRNSV